MNTKRGHEAARWVLRASRKPRHSSHYFRATTAELRRLLHDRTTPRWVRVYLYEWLRYRRRRG